jgi:glucose-6-phosphate 1-dehydrogenase
MFVKASNLPNPESPSSIASIVRAESWHYSTLSVCILGASGDLAKKKTYPSLLSLFLSGLLPHDTIIYGYARSSISDEAFRDKLRPFLMASLVPSRAIVDGPKVEFFLQKCFYISGSSYSDADAFSSLHGRLLDFERDTLTTRRDSPAARLADALAPTCNRLFYFAIPSNVFADAAFAIKQTLMGRSGADVQGWTRIIVEKPFGRDSESCQVLTEALSASFTEDHLYRIDHYLGKEMVQNLLILRFGNIWFERLWSRNDIASVLLTFKEPFGTDGRGGYFDSYGIIRDILQNHLLQVLTLIAMEPPTTIDGEGAGDQIRDAKVNILKAMNVITMEDCILGQYEGYTDDPTVNPDSTTATFAAVRCFVNTPRWAGVPFIMKAGKALDERKAEVRIQFKDAPAASFMFESPCPRNELVIRLQPKESIFMKTNVKTPGFSSAPIQSELEVDYTTKFGKECNPDAYTRLILDVLRGKTAGFVRNDELKESWKIFTPLLHQIEAEGRKPSIYKQGTRGPEEMDQVIEDWGYKRNVDAVYYDGKVLPKSKI